MSSAKSYPLDVRPSGRPLIYSRNKASPRTKPLGTPDSTGANSDLEPPTSSSTVCQKVFYQEVDHPLISVVAKFVDEEVVVNHVKCL